MTLAFPPRARFASSMTSLQSFFALCIVFLAMTLPAAQAGEAPYRHVVLFKFKDSSSEEEVQKIEKAFAALKDVEALKILDYEWGTNVSPEGLNDGFTHCFLVTFANKADLEAYLPHKAHQDFVSMLKPHLEKVLVVDYVARKSAD